MVFRIIIINIIFNVIIIVVNLDSLAIILLFLGQEDFIYIIINIFRIIKVIIVIL